MAPALFVRFPRFRFRPPLDPVIRDETTTGHPALASDLEILQRHVASDFHEQDEKALRAQNRYRSIQVALLIVSALLAGLGGLQAVWQTQRWPGILLAVLSAILVGMTRWADESQMLKSFLAARLKAERLRALYFRFLSQTKPFANDASRETVLRHAVLTITTAKGQLNDHPDATDPNVRSPNAQPERVSQPERVAQFHQLYHACRIVGQRNYYEDRRREYGAAHDQAVVLRNVLLVGAAIAAVIGQLFLGTGRAAWSVLGTLLAAFAGAVTGYESVIGFSRLAEVYGDAAAALERAEIDWDACGPTADQAALVTWVEEVITRENGQWGQLVTGTRPPVDGTGRYPGSGHASC